MKKFTKKVAKDIALTHFGDVLDSIIGNVSYGYDLNDSSTFFNDEFEEDLLNKGYTITPYKIRMINEYFDKERLKTIKLLKTKYKNLYVNHYL